LVWVWVWEEGEVTNEPRAYTTEDYLQITEEQAKALVPEEQRKGKSYKEFFYCCWISREEMRNNLYFLEDCMIHAVGLYSHCYKFAI